jgi:hypothetical protein
MPCASRSSAQIAISSNGQPVKMARAQIPDGDFPCGVYGQVDEPTDAAPPIVVSSYKVTSGQQGRARRAKAAISLFSPERRPKNDVQR